MPFLFSFFDLNVLELSSSCLSLMLPARRVSPLTITTKLRKLLSGVCSPLNKRYYPLTCWYHCMSTTKFSQLRRGSDARSSGRLLRIDKNMRLIPYILFPTNSSLHSLRQENALLHVHNLKPSLFNRNHTLLRRQT